MGKSTHIKLKDEQVLKKFFEYVKKDVKNITKDDVEDFFD